MRSQLFMVSILALASVSMAEAETLPPPPSHGPDEDYVFYQGDISLIGGGKRYERAVAVEKPVEKQWLEWKLDTTQFYPINSKISTAYNHKYFVRCYTPKAAQRGTVVVLYAQFRNEASGQNISCHVAGYVRMYK